MRPESITRLKKPGAILKSITLIMKTANNKAKLITLKNEIARARRRLQFLWNAKGCTDAEVLNASIELDLLINEYQRLFR